MRAEIDLIRARAELDSITSSLGETSGDEERNRAAAARQRSADAEVAREEARAYREELERQGSSGSGSAAAAAAAAEEIAQTQIDSASRLQLANDLAASGVRGLEDAIVTLATTGQGSFKDFADAIIGDLLRIIIRATITANLLRALGLGAGGEATGEGS